VLGKLKKNKKFVDIDFTLFPDHMSYSSGSGKGSAVNSKKERIIVDFPIKIHFDFIMVFYLKLRCESDLTCRCKCILK